MRISSAPAATSAAALLEAAGLPTGDLSELNLRHFFFVGPADSPSGLVGLEILPPVALLRSLVVDPCHRGSGVGSRLVEHAERHARALGVTSVYVLTTTAERFFSARGYARAEREQAPLAILATREFSDLCPASSAFMIKQLSI